MKLKTSKYGKRPRQTPKGPRMPGKPDAMSMGRRVTREAYVNREIEQNKPSRDETTASNKTTMDKFHSTLKPVRGLD